MKFSLFLISLLTFFFFTVSGLVSAQTANHCAVKQSPFRMAMDSGKRVYALQCLACHQVDGLGVSNMNPPLTGKRVLGDKNVLISIVIKGLATHEEIDGNKYQNVMPAHPDMKDVEIAYVLTYIRNSFGNKAALVKVSDVKSARSKLKITP